MIEKQFRRLDHRFGTHRPSEFGSQVCDGYRPDFILRNRRNQLAFIIEFESTPSRKTVLGDLTKAEKFSEDERRYATLAIVLRERSNTTAKQIAVHLKPYLGWLKKRRKKEAGLSTVLVITDKGYKASVSRKEAFGSRKFLNRCLDVSKQ